MKRLRILFILLPALVGLLRAEGTFTLEEILGSPFPSEMTASPSGGRVAWVVNERGVRNIWVAGPPEYRGEPVTKFSRDDGLTLSQLEWTPDGRALVFVRGDGPNRRGELPNPLNDPAGTERAIWLTDVDTKEDRRLVEGTSPRLHPSGDRIVYIGDNRVWQLSLKEGAEPESLIRARGNLSSLRWSPDGSKLAFVSSRGDHGFVGVYDAVAKSVRYLDPSVDRDSDPVWSGNSRKIAFRRVPAERRRLIFTPQREAQPWSIRVSDLMTGETKEIWRANKGPGSAFRGLASDAQLIWSRDGFIIFPWEADGWLHLYAVSEAGGPAVLLTPGEFAVEEAQLSADGTQIIFSSNQDDVDRRHLWETDARSGPPRPLTSGKSNEWSPTPLSQSGALAMIGSTGRSPARPLILLDGATPRPMLNLPADFPVDELVEPQQVIFSSADGMQIHGQLFLPSSGNSERRPAMLYFHGGSRRQMLLGWHYSSYYHNCYAFNQYLANQGYVVLSVNYRSGIMYGMEFREALNYGASGASEFNDVLGAGLYLRGRSDVDPRRIGLWGGSYGGYLTALGLARASHLFAAGVDVHGVHDWNVVINGFVPSYDPKDYPEESRLAFESSPMASIDTWASPVLLIHGDDDRNVPFSESVDLAAALRKREVEVEQLVFPDEVHGFLTYRSWLRAFQESADFLERRLANRP